MEILSIQKWMESGSGNGSGYGDGRSYGCSDGESDGSGFGSGDGVGNGYGGGSGCGDDRGGGYGGGTGRGDGSYDGSGCGSGMGRTGCADISFFCGSPVYEIDRVQTIITAVLGSYAKGYILGQCLTLTPCYIAKQESYFAHGETLSEAVEEVNEKAFKTMPEEERISEFWKYHKKGVKYTAKDFYVWHHNITGSCEIGRNTFVKEHGIDLNSDMFTVEEFVKLCETSYGGEIIRKLNEDGENE